MNYKNIFWAWLPFAVALTAMSGLIYASVQHNYRSTFNDPQIQIAEDVAIGLSEGKTISQLGQQVDIAKSLATFINVYDDKGEPIVYSGVLEGKAPSIPKGVLEYTRSKGEDRITWQPKPGVRSAIVVARFSSTNNSGFIVVGRNMRELEKRTKDLVEKVICAWAVSLVAVFASLAAPSAWSMLVEWFKKKRKESISDKENNYTVEPPIS